MHTSIKPEELAVSRLTESSELESIQAEWSALIQEVPGAPIFLSWEWNHTWWQHYQDQGDLWLITVRDRSGALIGIAPLKRSMSSGGLFGLRTVAFLFDLPPVHLDILARLEDRSAVCSALIDYLSGVKHEWELLDLRGLAEDSCLKDELAQRPGHFQVRAGLTCPYITLPPDWETFEKKSLSANRRKQIRSNQRRLERDYPGQVTFRRIDDPVEIHAALDLLIQFNRDKWRDRDGVSAFEDERYRSFTHAITALAQEYGWLRFYDLKVGQELLSARLEFAYGGVFYDFQTAFNPHWSAYAPGELLLVHIVKAAVEEGISEFDFLPGTYRWKMSWSTGARQESHIVFGHNWRSYRALAGAAVFERAIVIGRKILPGTTRERINLWISRRKHRDLANRPAGTNGPEE